MIYKEYGKTGKLVSKVGFGGMRFDLSKSNEENAELLLYAREKGINYFDTAPFYCDDRSQKIYGIAFEQMKEHFYVSTKSNPDRIDTKEKLYDRFSQQLELLKVDKINFYHVWCIREMKNYNDAMKIGGLYEGLLELQQKGLIDHIAFSTHQTGSEIRRVINDNKFEGVLLGLNIINFPYRWDGVMAANEANIGVVVMNPLGGGEIPKHEKEFSFLAQNGETPTEAALRFIIHNPNVTVALNGFTTKEHIDLACKIADTGVPLTDLDILKIKTRLGNNMNEACTACGYCDKCPQDIKVPSFMQVYNEKHLYNRSDEEMIKYMKTSYNLGLLVGQKGKSNDCIECGICEKECTQKLPIIKRLKEISKWTEIS